MEFEYIDELSIDENLKCSICNDPFEEPVTTCCDHTFCLQCIQQWLNKHDSCPTCRQLISNIQTLIPIKTRLILNMLDGLPVKCKSCYQTNIQRGNFQDHLKICRKTNLFPCSASDSQCSYEQIRPILTKIILDYRQFKEQFNQLNQKYQQLRSEVKSTMIRTITFESLLSQNQFGQIPNGFAGLNWTHVRFTNEENFRTIILNKTNQQMHPFSYGYSCVAYNDWRKSMIISSLTQNFTFRACEIMSLNHLEENSKLNIVARKDQLTIYSKVITLKREVLQVIQFNSWMDINQIEFSIDNAYFILTWIQLEEKNFFK